MTTSTVSHARNYSFGDDFGGRLSYTVRCTCRADFHVNQTHAETEDEAVARAEAALQAHIAAS